MGAPKNSFEWTEAAIEKLRGLWDEGLVTTDIGLRMGISKSAVVGKAHRLNLPARPSPIKFGATVKERGPAPIRRGPTLPPLASSRPFKLPGGDPAPFGASIFGINGIAQSTMTAGHGHYKRRGDGAVFDKGIKTDLDPDQEARTNAIGAAFSNIRRAEQRAIDAETESRVATFVPRPPRSRPCCWPIGEPGTKAFRFCDAATTSTKPYCPVHCAVAYVNVRDRQPAEFVTPAAGSPNPNFARGS